MHPLFQFSSHRRGRLQLGPSIAVPVGQWFSGDQGNFVRFFKSAADQLFLLAILLITFAFAGCGGDDSAPGAVVASATTVAARSAAASSEGGSTVDAANAFLGSLTLAALDRAADH